MMAQNLLNFVLYTVLHTTAVTAQYIISKSLSLVTLVNCVGVTATEPRHNAMRRWRRSCLIIFDNTRIMFDLSYRRCTDALRPHN